MNTIENNLENKIKTNEERLISLKKKRENLDLEILRLERKILNQKNSLMNQKSLEEIEL